MKHPFITILTPTYNRASLLPRLFDSLLRQTNKDFEWIVVDDGSTDDTREVVANLKEKCGGAFPMGYVYKANGGKHMAINIGAERARGELLFIADSDDLLTDDALETVANSWHDISDDKSFAGIAGLDIAMDTREVIGSGLPQEHIDCNAIDIRYRHHVTGDMKEVFRTEVLREFPFPEFAGERFCPEQLVWFRMARRYRLRYINKPIYIADYQPDGITAGITRARMRNPSASMLTYAELTECPVPFLVKVKAAINFWRFWHCRTATSVVPRVALRWHWLRPLGWMMHVRDGNALRK
ncbi:MAG: glycosyltransferase family A protein [Prevotella sp.]|nr:glycosyltransferase family A protein [Prevotella sp.]